MAGYTRYLFRMLPRGRPLLPGFGPVFLGDWQPSSRLLWPSGHGLMDRMMRDVENSMLEMERLRTAFFNSSPLALRDRDVRSKPDQDGGKGHMEGKYRFSVDVAGFTPEELTVTLDGRKVTVAARRQQESQGEDGYWHEHQELRRETLLPDDVDLQGITCSLTSDGQLCVEGPRLASPSTEKTIPIDVKPAAQETPGTSGADKESEEKQKEP